ncbi:cytochrome P450 [Nonomuraea sp. MG754425]|uniref:cytochrome P450 n=1 Tax=Nonomuraea sp. MG754425 TaxID=2570319 RepID=UPI001F1D9F54|nr:cytochrome P450 [Nonomuraea sp. MG754425]MCF6470019.1 cytochrome P450 [Nonomuraea sp. MG754425]
MTTAPPAFPQARVCPHLPPPAYEELRQGPPLSRVTTHAGQTAWLVTRYHVARTLLKDPRLSSDRRRPGFPVISVQVALLTERKRQALIGMDPPEHDIQRRMFLPDFTLKKVRERRADIERIVNEELDKILDHGPPADLFTEFALPVPFRVICRLLGAPWEDHEFFQDAIRRLVRTFDTEEGRQAGRELLTYFEQLVTDFKKTPDGAGLIGRLSGSGRISDDDLALAAMSLLIAGHETTAAMISLGAVTLMENPAQLAAIRANPEAIVPAVEELLRFQSIADSANLRVATDDIEIDGVLIKAGEGLLIPGSLANRDAEIFESPDTFDANRDAGGHIAFGYGRHQCLGQNLARLELQIALTALWQRIPNLRMAVPAGELNPRPPGAIQGIDALPVTW